MHVCGRCLYAVTLAQVLRGHRRGVPRARHHALLRVRPAVRLLWQAAR